MTKTWYKIVEKVGDDYFLLFHGVNRTRKIPKTEWLTAEVKTVCDGSKGTEYQSGFHILESYEDCLKYLKKFKNLKTKHIIECEAEHVWSKEHSRDNVFLAEKIKI
jgi:hypothetical protein